MKVGELLSMPLSEMYEWLGEKFDMPPHYVRKFFDACDEYGLSDRQTLRALTFAYSLVGSDLDSWIYGDDLERYVSVVLGEE